jgi:hypothetical protein
MSSEASQEIEAAGLPFVLGMRTPAVPYLAAGSCREHPREEIPTGRCSSPAPPAATRRRTKPSQSHLNHLPHAPLWYTLPRWMATPPGEII